VWGGDDESDEDFWIEMGKIVGKVWNTNGIISASNIHKKWFQMVSSPVSCILAPLESYMLRLQHTRSLEGLRNRKCEGNRSSYDAASRARYDVTGVTGT